MARASIAPPNLNGHVYSCVQEVRFLQQKCQFGHYFRADGAINQNNVLADYTDIQNYWFATVRPILIPVLSVGTLIQDLRIWCLNWPNIATGIFPMGSVAGSFAGDPLPPQIAGVLTKQTALRGRSGRGRMYLCGMSEDASTNGAPTNPALVAMANLCAILKVPFIGGGTGRTFTPCVVSLKAYAVDSVDPPVPPNLNPTPHPPPIIPRGGDITTMVADVIWGTQRRRTFGRGQ